MAFSGNQTRSDAIWHGVEAQPWTMPELDQAVPQSGAAEPEPEGPKPPTAAEIAAICEQARQEGYNEGREAGLRDAQQDLDSLRLVAAQMVRPLAELDTEVERSLVNLALTLARRMVGQVVEAEAETLQQLVHKVVSHLGSLEAPVDIQLHPQDHARLLQVQNLDPLWRLHPNADLQPADVIVTQDDAQIDGRLSQRVERLAADMLDGQ